MESLPFTIAGCCEAGANLRRLRAHGWVHPGQGANPPQANNLIWPNLYTGLICMSLACGKKA